MKGSAHPQDGVSPAVVWMIALAIMMVALVVRLYGLDVRSLSHPEIYIPGIDLVAGISDPPPRHEFWHTLRFHWHVEPHPIGYYMGMFAWTSVFGTSEFVLRLPSVLFGTGSVLVVFLLARRVYALPTAFFAAAMLALHGHHVLWSQTARMYVPVEFWCLLATLLLLEIARSQEPRRLLECAYVLVLWAAAETSELFWTILAVHMVWVALLTAQKPGSPGPRIVQLQGLAAALGAPVLLHAVYRGRPNAVEDPVLDGVHEYFSMGFLYIKDDHRIPTLEPWVLLSVGLPVLCVLLLAASTRVAAEKPAGDVNTQDPLPRWLPLSVAIVMAIIMAVLALTARSRGAYLLPLAILPLLTLLLPMILRFAVWIFRKIPFLDRLNPSVTLLWLLGVLAPLGLFALTNLVQVYTPRTFLIYAPYLIILCGAGICGLSQAKVVRTVVVCGLVALFAGSLVYARFMPGTPNDYKALAYQMHQEMQPDDLVIVRNQNWVDTPAIYYIGPANYVTNDYADALQNQPDRRVWLIYFIGRDFIPKNDPRLLALEGRELIGEIQANRASAELYGPTD